MAKKESKKSGAAKMAGDGREAALKRAMKDIDERFGTGAVMRLGDQDKLDIDAISTGPWVLVGFLKAALRKFMVRNPPVRPQWPCTSSPNVKSRGEQLLLLMQNTL